MRDSYAQEYKWEDQCRNLVEKMKSIHRGRELLVPLIHSFMHYTEYTTSLYVHVRSNYLTAFKKKITSQPANSLGQSWGVAGKEDRCWSRLYA